MLPGSASRRSLVDPQTGFDSLTMVISTRGAWVWQCWGRVGAQRVLNASHAQVDANEAQDCYIPDTSMSAGRKAAKKATAAAKASPPSRDNRDDVAKDWASSS